MSVVELRGTRSPAAETERIRPVWWVGGGLTLTLLAIRAERADDTGRLLEIGEQPDWAGTRVYLPPSVLLLIRGIAMTINGDLDWAFS